VLQTTAGVAAPCAFVLLVLRHVWLPQRRAQRRSFDELTGVVDYRLVAVCGAFLFRACLPRNYRLVTC